MLTELLRLWPIIVTVLTVVAGWGAGKYALSVLTTRLDRLDTSFTNMNAEMNRLSTSVAVQSATMVAHTEQDRLQFDNLTRDIMRVTR